MRFPLWLVALPLLSLPAPAQCGDDAFEDNDSIGSAAAVGPGTYAGLVITSSQSACGVDEDFYRIDVADGDVLRVDLAFDTTQGNIGLWLYESPGDFPDGYVARSTTLLDHEVVSYPNHTGSTRTYYTWVDVVNAFDTNVYDMEVATFPDPCVGQAPDTFEPNDTFATAAPIVAGLHPGLVGNAQDDDFYTLTVPSGQALRARALFAHDRAANLSLRLLDAGTGLPLRSSFTYDDDEVVTWPNSSGAHQAVVLHTYLTGGTDTCLDYALSIELFPDPCLTLPEDPFEDNDDCSQPIYVTPGTYAGLGIFAGERDVFRIAVPDGQTLTVDLLFSHEDGNVDAKLYNEALVCTHVPDAIAESTTDDEHLEATNLIGATFEFQWEIEVLAGQTGTFLCNEYTMVVNVSGATGNTFCDASDGALAACPCGNPGAPDAGCDLAQGTSGISLAVTGQSVLPQNRATLSGAGYPPAGSPGVTVIRSDTLDAASPVVFGDGLRCIGTPVVRVGATLASGGTSVQTVGHGSGAGPGTFYYQLWVRNTPAMYCDPAAAFNLSNGREIVW